MKPYEVYFPFQRKNSAVTTELRCRKMEAGALDWWVKTWEIWLLKNAIGLLKGWRAVQWVCLGDSEPWWTFPASFRAAFPRKELEIWSGLLVPLMLTNTGRHVSIMQNLPGISLVEQWPPIPAKVIHNYLQRKEKTRSHRSDGMSPTEPWI